MASEPQIDLDALPAEAEPRKHIFGGQPKTSSVPGAELLPEDFGDRFRIARESAGRSIEDAARGINVPVPLIESIEEGASVPGYTQLKDLMDLYGASVDGVLGRDSALVNLAASFKGTNARRDRATKDAILLLTRLVQSEIELELLLGAGRKEELPGCLPLLEGDVQPQAEQNAAKLREQSGLGAVVSPVQGLSAACWLEQVGVRIHVGPADDSVRGVYVHDSEVGACVLLNSAHPVGCVSEALAHALAHLCSFRGTPNVHYLGDSADTRRHAYADAFARAFLMPRAAVARRLREFAGESGRLSRRHAVLMAHQFGVSADSVFPRLSELGLANAGSGGPPWGGRITESEATGILGNAGVNVKGMDASTVAVPRLRLLAEQSWRRLLRSEGQLARMLGLDLVTLRGMMGPMESCEQDAGGLR